MGGELRVVNRCERDNQKGKTIISQINGRASRLGLGNFGLNKMPLSGVIGRLGTIRGVGLVEDVSNVVANSSEADEQFFGDLPVSLAGGN